MYNKSNLAVVAALSKTHYAKSVFFSDKGTVATDGHIAVSVSMPENAAELIKDAPLVGGKIPTIEVGEFEVSGDNIKTLTKSLKGRPRFPLLDNAFVIKDGDEKRLVATDLENVVSVPAREPEDYRKGMRDLNNLRPGGKPTLRIALGGELLARFVDIFNKAIADGYDKEIIFSIWDKDHAIVAEAKRAETGQTILGMIMPRCLKEED